MNHRIALAFAAAALVSSSSVAYAQEVSTAAAFDRLYATHFEAAGGLPALRQSQQAAMPSDFSIRELRYIDVLGFDTSGTNALTLVAAGREAVLFQPGPWTPPSRGWRPAGEAPIDIARTLSTMGLDPQRTRFALYVGGVPMSAGNTVMLRAPNGSEFVLGYNDGGVDHADADLNEPVLRGRGDDAVYPSAVAPSVSVAPQYGVAPMTTLTFTVHVQLAPGALTSGYNPTQYVAPAQWVQPSPVVIYPQSVVYAPMVTHGPTVVFPSVTQGTHGPWMPAVRPGVMVPQRVFWR